MKIYIRNIFIGLNLFAFSLFMMGLFLSEQVSAQTTSSTNKQEQSEFKQDVEQGIKEVKNDKDAQNNQEEIDNEDSEHAGDEHGEVKEIDGENNQTEIDNEIEQEIDQENATSSESSDQERVSNSSTTEKSSSSDNTDN